MLLMVDKILFLLSLWNIYFYLLEIFYYFFNYFNWRLITLQYCGGFCHTSTWINHRCTYVPLSWTLLPPPSLPHPSGLSQSTGFECCASCIELALVLCFTYGDIHVSMLFSQIIPVLPSPTEPKSLFFIYLCLFCCLAYRVNITVFLNSIYMHYMHQKRFIYAYNASSAFFYIAE